MFYPKQKWYFTPLLHSRFNVWNYVAICFIPIGAILHIGLQHYPFTDVEPFTVEWLILMFICAMVLIWALPKLYQELVTLYHWDKTTPEYILMDYDSLHFHVFPHSASLKYSEIKQVAYLYETRVANKREWDENTGVIIITANSQIALNLERLIQSNDGITLGSNSNVIMTELNKRIQHFQVI